MNHQFIFEFDAPKYYDFTRKSLLSNSIQINLDSSTDKWFLVEHNDISPLKIQQNIKIHKKQLKIQKKKQQQPIKRNIFKLQQVAKKNTQYKTQHNRNQNKIQKQTNFPPKKCLSVCSQNSTRSQSHNYRIPCPFPPRIQRLWETSSNKSWYSLSAQSMKKAEVSMKQLTGKNTTKYKSKQQKNKFKF